MLVLGLILGAFLLGTKTSSANCPSCDGLPTQAPTASAADYATATAMAIPPTPTATLAPTAAPVVTEAPASNEVTCRHENSGEFVLNPGESMNGGHLFAFISGKWMEWEFVDNKTIVVRNNSDSPIRVNSTDGAGVCTSSGEDQVFNRFSEGCDATGCGEVKDVNITSPNALPAVTNILEKDWCAINTDSVYCLNIDK
jgi:hypothetical protein